MTTIDPNASQVILYNVEVTFGGSYFGLIHEVKITFKPIIAGRDSYGRSIACGFDFKAEWTMFQVNYLTLGYTSTSQNADAPGTVVFKGLQSDGTPTDLTITSVKPNFDYEFNGDGGKGIIKVSVDKIMTLNDFYVLWT